MLLDRPSLTEQDMKRGNEKREMDDTRREYKVEELWESECWENFKTED